MSNIDAMIMNAANTAAQSQPAQQAVEVQQEFIPANSQAQFQQQYVPQQQFQQQQFQQPVQQPQFQQPVQQQQFQQPVQQQQFQQPVQQQQFQQPVQQQQFQQPVQQQQFQQQPVQQQQFQQQPVQQQFQQPVQQQQFQQQPVQQQQTGMISHQPAGTANPAQLPAQQMQMAAGQLPAHLMQMPTTLSMETFMSMGISVDLWLKPDYVGMTVGENSTPVEEVIVEIDMTEHTGFTPIFGIRYGKDPVRYDYTRDGVTNKDGLSWQAALYQAYMVDPTVSPYRAVQIPMTVLKECKNMKGETVASSGSSLGYTTSVTNFTQWEELYRHCVREKLIGQRVAVKLTNVPKAKNNNKWGVIHFELLGAAAQYKAA